jgi:hypothetical protein
MQKWQHALEWFVGSFAELGSISASPEDAIEPESSERQFKPRVRHEHGIEIIDRMDQRRATALAAMHYLDQQGWQAARTDVGGISTHILFKRTIEE